MKLKDFLTAITDYNNYSNLLDLEHFFNVYYDESKKVFKFNLNSSIYLDVSDDNCPHASMHMDLHWPIISYNIYGTTRLAWLLMKLNNVKAENAFNIVLAGTIIKYIPIETILSIVKSYY